MFLEVFKRIDITVKVVYLVSTDKGALSIKSLLLHTKRSRYGLELSQLRWISFVCTEQYYCLKGMYIFCD